MIAFGILYQLIWVFGPGQGGVSVKVLGHWFTYVWVQVESCSVELVTCTFQCSSFELPYQQLEPRIHSKPSKGPPSGSEIPKYNEPYLWFSVDTL